MFSFLNDVITFLLTNYVNDTSSAICTNLYLVATLVLVTTLYFTIFGYMIAVGSVQHSMPELIKRALIIVVVLGIAFTAGAYQTTVISLTESLEGTLLELIPAPGGLSVDPVDIFGSLDSTFTTGMAKAYEAIELSSNNKDQTTLGIFFSEFGCGLLIGISTMILSLYCAIYLLMAKIAIAILLAIGPIFIICVLYPATRRYFDKWLGLLCTYVLTFVLMAVVTVIVLKIFGLVLDAITISQVKTNFIIVAFETLVAAIFLVTVVFQIPQIAAGLCGGGGLLNPSSAYYAITSPAQTVSGKGGAMMPVGKMMATGAGGMPGNAMQPGNLSGGASTTHPAFRGPMN